MRITFVHDEPELYPVPAGGKERLVMNLAEALAKHPEIQEVNVLTRTARIPDRQKVSRNGITIARYSGYELPRHILDAAQKSQIVSAHTCSFQMPSLNVDNCRFVNHVHDIVYATVDRGSHLDKAISANYAAIYSPSEFVTNFIKNLFWWSDIGERVITIPRGFDIDSIQSAKATRLTLDESVQTELNSDAMKFFFPNRVNSFKGEQFLHEFMETIRSRGTPFKIFLPRKLHEQSSGLTAPELVNIPWLTGRELYAFYARMSATLCFSLNPEAFCQSVLDSLASGTPVITFPFGNTYQLGQEFPAVHIVQPSGKAAAEAAIELCLDRERMKTDLAESSSILRSRYSLDKIADKYVDTFKRILPARALNLADVSVEPTKYCMSPYVAQLGTETFVASGERVEKIRLCDEHSKLTGLLKTPQSIEAASVRLRLPVRNVEANVNYLLNQGVLIEV